MTITHLKTPLKTLALLYATGINISSFGLFYYDKQQALKKRWRIPEKTLQLSALLGGWIGGITAMNKFRHKTIKEPFRSVYFGCVFGNFCLIGAGVVFRRNIVKYLRNANISHLIDNSKYYLGGVKTNSSKAQKRKKLKAY